MRSFILLASVLLCSAAAEAESKVWIEPFKEANQQQPDWITRALQQSLTDELSTNGAQVLPGAAKPAEARYVVTATIQRQSGELRVSGQVIDVEGKTVGGFKATGTERDLFALEDSIGSQVSKAVGVEVKLVAGAPANGAAPRVEAPFAPARFGYDGSELQDAVRRDRPIEPRPVIQYDTPIYSPQMYQPANYNYGGGYYPPSYGYNWGWGYNYPSVIVVNNGHGHHGGNGGGGIVCPPGGNGGINTGVPANNGQAIRAVSGFGGRTPPPGVINTITNTSAPGVIHTMGGVPASGNIARNR